MLQEKLEGISIFDTNFINTMLPSAIFVPTRPISYEQLFQI